MNKLKIDETAFDAEMAANAKPNSRGVPSVEDPAKKLTQTKLAPADKQPGKPVVAPVAKKKKGGGEVYLTPVSPVAVAMSIRHLAVMLKSGLALEQAVKVLSGQAEDKRIQSAWDEVAVDIVTGRSLAEAMSKHRNVFNEITISMISVGEQGGTLEKNLHFLADFLKNAYELQRKVKGALVYPMIVFSFTFLEMLGVIVFILPRLEPLFKSMPDVPAFTQFLLNLSNFVRTNGLATAGIFVGAIIIFKILFSTPPGKKFATWLSLNFPIIGKLTKFTLITTFSRTMNILMGGGMPLSTALKIASETIGNYKYKEILEEITENVKSGQNLADSLAKYPKYFEPTYIRMIEVGESTGTLEDNFQQLYEFYEEDVKEMTTNMTTLLEPILLIFIGCMIGLLAITIISPVYQLASSINSVGTKR